MKRGGRLNRFTPLRSKTRIRKRAPIRAGLLVEQIDATKELARAVCMVRAGAIMLAQGGKKGGRPQWWGRCQSDTRHEGFLQWCHIRGQKACPSLACEPLNAFVACGECHFGKWHDKRGIQREAETDIRREFLATIRTPEEIAWLYGPHGKRDAVLQAATNFDALETLTHGHAERAMWPEHFRTIVEMIDRPNLAARLEI